MDLKFKTIRTVATHMRRNDMGALSRFAHWTLMVHNNCFYEPDQNGEEAFARWAPAALNLKTVFDVGANVGEWTEEMREYAPGAQYYCFEPLPMNFEKLEARLGGAEGVSLNNFGLAREDGSLDVHYNTQYQTTATTAPVHTDLVAADASGKKGEMGVAHTEVATCHFRAVGPWLAEQGIDVIDLLKIDVEGMDYEVVSSFPVLGPRIRAIQFEYTLYSRLNHVILKDFYELLIPAGYKVFKFFPTWLQRCDYDFGLERYADGNYLALHDETLAAMGAADATKIHFEDKG